jgi:predicted dehydrogenase
MSEIRFAVVGTGRMAASMMATFARADVLVTGIASCDLERARRFASAFRIPTALDSLGSLLRSTEVDAVYIANAPSEHAATAIMALEAGKAVLCEKPFALSSNEGARVVEVARRTGKLCMEGIWTSFLPAYQRFFELARTKACGEPSHLLADFGYPVSEEALPRLLSPAAGGVLLDRGVYLVALALNLFGSVERVDARLDVTSRGVDQHASLQLSHRRGGLSQLSASFTSLMSNTATLACSRGLIRLEEPLIGAERVATRRVATERISSWEDPLANRSSQKVLGRLRQSHLVRRLKQALPSVTREYLSYGPDKYLPQLEHFLGLMKEGAQQSGVVPLELSLNIQRVIDHARADHRR